MHQSGQYSRNRRLSAAYQLKSAVFSSYSNKMPGEGRSLQQMLVSLVHDRETEMARVARILHDDVGQVLSAIGLQLDVLRMDFSAEAPGIADRVAEIQRLLESAIDRVRDLSFELNPATVERAGLQFALERLIGRARDGYAGTLRLLYDSSVRLPLTAAMGAYRIVEFAIDNAVRHSGATQIEVLARPSGAGFAIEVRDNGAGFAPEAPAQDSLGLGLMFMDLHARRAALELVVDSRPGRGTIIRIYHRAEPAEAEGSGVSGLRGTGKKADDA